AENHSFGLDMTTRGGGVSVIVGDGAGAVVVSASDEPNRGIITDNMHSEGEFAEELAVLFPGSRLGWSDVMMEDGNNLTAEQIYPHMNGNFVFKHAVTRFPESIKEAFEKSGENFENLKLFIPHQANL